MAKCIFLIDLDLTLIDVDYKPTIPLTRFRECIEELDSQGHVFCLNSDSPLQILSDWKEVFGFHGPIIFEKGASIYFPNGEEVATIDEHIDWASFKRSVERILREIEPSLRVIEVDYRKYFQGEETWPTRNGLVSVISPFRRHSFGMHLQKVNGSTTVKIDPELFQDIMRRMYSGLQKEFDLDLLALDANSTYSVFIAYESFVRKSCAIPLLRTAYPRATIIAIGDGSTDAELKDTVDELWAVGNAVNDLKKVAKRVSEKSITGGVLELLETRKA